MTTTKSITIVGIIAGDFATIRELLVDKALVKLEKRLVICDNESTYSYEIAPASSNTCVVIYNGPLNDMFRQDGFPSDLINIETLAIVTVGTAEYGYMAPNCVEDFQTTQRENNPLIEIYCDNDPTMVQTQTPPVDTEYDAFADRVASHDKHYQFSDDLNVWRRGDAEHKDLAAIAESKGGRYKQLWDNIYKTTSVV